MPNAIIHAGTQPGYLSLAKHAAECSIKICAHTHSRTTHSAFPQGSGSEMHLPGHICSFFKIPQLINQDPHQQSPCGLTKRVGESRLFPAGDFFYPLEPPARGWMPGRLCRLSKAATSQPIRVSVGQKDEGSHQASGLLEFTPSVPLVLGRRWASPACGRQTGGLLGLVTT